MSSNERNSTYKVIVRYGKLYMEIPTQSVQDIELVRKLLDFVLEWFRTHKDGGG